MKEGVRSSLIKREIACKKGDCLKKRVIACKRGRLPEKEGDCLKKREIAWKRGRLPEKEGDCLKKREIAWKRGEIAWKRGRLPEKEGDCLREIAWKRGKLSEKEGDCLKMREMCRQLRDNSYSIWQLHCSCLVQFLHGLKIILLGIFNGENGGPSQALFPGSYSKICLNVLHFHH